MKRYKIVTDSVTYAIKVKDLLRIKGYKAKIERSNNGVGKNGCSFSVITNGDFEKLKNLLYAEKINFKEIIEI